MSYTAGDVMGLAASLLNDVNRELFNDTVQLPYLRMAHDELNLELLNNGVDTQLVVFSCDPLAGDRFLSLPPNFFLPIKLEERKSTSTNLNDFIEMHEVWIESIGEPTLNISEWSFRNNRVYIYPSTEAKNVRLTYYRNLSPIIDASTTQEVGQGKTYLALRTAALCAEFVGGNSGKSRADSLNLQAALALNSLMSVFVKNAQGVRVRRKPFRISGINWVRFGR